MYFKQLLISKILIWFLHFGYVHAVDLVGEWNSISAIPSSYQQIPATNVLRCGKLCERQSGCIAVTFDNKDSVCYLHDTNVTTDITRSTKRYLFKKYRELDDPDSKCDTKTQIRLPSAHKKNGHCYNIGECLPTTAKTTAATTTTTTATTMTTEEVTTGSMGGECSSHADCVVEYSECRYDSTCGCKVGYSFKSSTGSCEASCDTYGDTFEHFTDQALRVQTAEQYVGITVEKCMQYCIALPQKTCVSFDFTTGGCYLKQVDALDAPA